jgi:hypothetical protein
MEFQARTALTVALRNTFNRETLTSMLLRLGKKLEDLVPDHQTYPRDVEAVVLIADQEGWAWELVDKAIEAAPLSAHLKTFTAAYPVYDPGKGPRPIMDYLMAHMLRGGRCFIDRTDLREKLKQLRAADSRVLIVTGDRLSGKTYTAELINFLCDKTANYKAIHADLDRYPFDAYSLTEHLGSQMGLDPLSIPKQDQEQMTRWILRLCDWITARIVNPGNLIYWFVFDGFRQQPLLPDARELISELALRAEGNIKQCRIVLLNYTEQLPLQINDYVLREQVKSIGRAELCEFFNQANSQSGRNFSDADLSSKVDLIIEQVDSALAGNAVIQGDRLRQMGLAVSETYRYLFA